MTEYWPLLLDNVVLSIFLSPLAGACAVFIAARCRVNTLRRIALASTLFTFVFSALMVAHYDPALLDENDEPQLIQMRSGVGWLATEKYSLVQRSDSGGETHDSLVRELRGPNVQLAVGVDGLSLLFVALTSALMIPAVLAGRDVDGNGPAVFYMFLLLLEAALIGAYAATDAVFFAMCLGFAPVPLLFLVGRWGGYDRRRAVIKFFIFQVAGSLLLLFALVALVVSHDSMRSGLGDSHVRPSFDLNVIIQQIPQIVAIDEGALAYWEQVGPWIFLALVTGFAVRCGLFPLHTWLPPMSGESPAAAGIPLVVVSLLFGVYGFIRFVPALFADFFKSPDPLFPVLTLTSTDIVTLIAISGAIYAALLALAQDDLKKLVTFIGLSHFGICVAGACSLNPTGMMGSLLQLLGLGLSIGALVFLTGALESRYRTREIEAFAGLRRQYPRFSLCWLVAALAVIGVPGSAGFPGQLLVLFGILQGSPQSTSRPFSMFFLLVALLILAWALVTMLHRMLTGRYRRPVMVGGAMSQRTQENGATENDPTDRTVRSDDLSLRETTAVMICFAAIVWIGVYPQFFLSRMQPSVSNLLRRYHVSVPSDEPAHNTPANEL